VLQLLSSRVSAQAHTPSILTQPGAIHVACQPGLERTLPQSTHQAVTAPRMSLASTSGPGPYPDLLPQCCGCLSDEGITLPALHSPSAPGSVPTGCSQTLILTAG